MVYTRRVSISLIELELTIFRRKFPPRNRDQHDQMLEADKLEFTRRYKKLMLTLINAPTPDWPFIESFPTLGEAPALSGHRLSGQTTADVRTQKEIPASKKFKLTQH